VSNNVDGCIRRGGTRAPRAKSSDDERTEYNGSVEYEGDDSTEQLLDQFKQIQSE